MTKRRFTPEQDAQLRAEYEAGKDYPRLAAEYGGTDVSVRAAVLRAGGASRPPRRGGTPPPASTNPRTFPTVESCGEIREKYEAGASMKALAVEYDCTDRTIGNAIRRAGGRHRPGGRPSNWTPERTARLIAAYEAGVSIETLAVRYQVADGAVRQKLRREGALDPGRSRNVGERHPNWQGWTIVGGYVYVKPKPEDLAFCVPNGAGYVAEHRLVMGRSLGRPLMSTETVHHMNGLRDDNCLENLQLRQGQHGKGIRPICLDCGSHNIGAAEL